MSAPNELIPRPFSAAPDEVEALLGALHRNRRTFAWKTGGLDADAMRRTLGPSTVTLGGLVKHLALVEDHYFTHQLLGRDSDLQIRAYPQVVAPSRSRSRRSIVHADKQHYVRLNRSPDAPPDRIAHSGAPRTTRTLENECRAE